MKLLPLALLVVACASESDDRPPSWSYIHAAIVVPNCARAGCHSTLTRTANVDLEDKDTAYLVMQNAQNAYLDILLLLEGKVPAFYRMPPDQPLPEADIDLVRRWILAGAQDD